MSRDDFSVYVFTAASVTIVSRQQWHVHLDPLIWSHDGNSILMDDILEKEQH